MPELPEVEVVRKDHAIAEEVDQCGPLGSGGVMLEARDVDVVDTRHAQHAAGELELAQVPRLVVRRDGDGDDVEPPPLLPLLVLPLLVFPELVLPLLVLELELLFELLLLLAWF